MKNKIGTIFALLLTANTHAGEEEVQAHLIEVVTHLQAIEAIGINNPRQEPAEVGSI